MTQYGLRDLITALADARSYVNAVPELRDYSHARYYALAGAFGLAKDEMPGLHEDDPDVGDPLGQLFERAMRSLDEVHSPFAGILEAPQNVIRIYRHHGPVLDERFGAARQAVVDLLVDLAVLRWGLPAAATVTAEDLRDQGFDPSEPAPDPDDFW